MSSNTKLISLAATVGLLSAPLVLPVSFASAADYSDDHPFTVAEAKLIHQGKIVYDDGSPTGLIDLSLTEGAVMNPEADDDFDGIKNKDELHVYTKNGQQYLHYLSHPKLKDTDGDGISDKDDPDKLSWNIHARDAVIFQELVYRDDSYQLEVLGQDAIDGHQSVEVAYEKTMLPLPENKWYKGRKQYGLMRREAAPFWNVVRSWHTDSGFDATMYEFSNKTFPYLKDKSVHVLGIRGTAGAKDVGVDISLGLGQWMGQDTDAQNVAKELVNQQQRFKNITVTGHSLGGYLSQMFFVASLGGKYGEKAENGEDNYNYYNHDKVYNPEVKHVFGFNAPRIHHVLSKSLKEYYWLGKFLDKKFKNTYFQVNNDSVVRSHPDAVTYIGNSDAGHSSLSFWEKKFANLDGFSVGERNDLSGLGYREPALKSVRFVHRTIVKIRENGKELEEVILPKTKDEIAAINKDALTKQIDPAVVIDGPVNLKYGEVNTVNGRIKTVNVTYKFVVKGQTDPIATKVVKTKYKTDYKVPSIPESVDPDYKYVSQVTPLPKVLEKDLTEDKEITVTLIKEPVKNINTKVIFKDGSKVVKTITKDTKPSEGDPKLTASDFPEGYVIPDPLPKLTAGKDNEISLTPKEFTLTFKYVDVTKANAVVGKSDTEKVKYGRDSQYQLNIPSGYQLADNYSYISPADVKADASVEIKIKPEQTQNWQLTFVYKHKGKTVGTQVAAVKTGEKVDLQIPTHRDSNKTYVLKTPTDTPYVVAGPRPTSGKESKDIEVLEKVTPSPINPDTVIRYYDVTLNYMHEGKQVKSETKRLRQDAPIVVTVPKSSSGTYMVEENAKIPGNATKTETINVPLKFTPNVYQVTLRYVYTKDNDTRVIETENQQVADGSKPVLKERIKGESAGRYYQPEADYKAPTVSGPLVVNVPLKYVVNSHRVTVKYMDGAKQVGADEVQQVKEGETATLKLPAATDFDGHYVLADDFNNPLITGDRELIVPLKRDINSYEVTLNYQLDGETKANSFQLVESGKTAKNDYEVVVKDNNNQALKKELAKYEVDPSYDWSVKITQKTTLNIPLKRKMQTINVPSKPTVKDPCGLNNASWNKPVDSKDITWVVNTEKHLVASITDGYVFAKESAPAGVSISTDGKTADYGVAVDSGAICKVEDTQVKEPKVKDTQVKAAQVAASTDSPNTGSHAGLFAGLGMLLAVFGLALCARCKKRE